MSRQKSKETRGKEPNEMVSEKQANENKNAKEVRLPDSSLAPQVQLSQLVSILWLKLEHHACFQRLFTFYISRKTKNLTKSVIFFIKEYGPRLWPEGPERRHHLVVPRDSSLPAYFDTLSGPYYSSHAQLLAKLKANIGIQRVKEWWTGMRVLGRALWRGC